MGMRQDALLTKDDLLKARQNSPRSDVNKALRDETFVGDAHVAPKRIKNKHRTLPDSFGGWYLPQSR